MFGNLADQSREELEFDDSIPQADAISAEPA